MTQENAGTPPTSVKDRSIGALAVALERGIEEIEQNYGEGGGKIRALPAFPSWLQAILEQAVTTFGPMFARAAIEFLTPYANPGQGD
jgi:hypothetical protein